MNANRTLYWSLSLAVALVACDNGGAGPEKPATTATAAMTTQAATPSGTASAATPGHEHGHGRDHEHGHDHGPAAHGDLAMMMIDGAKKLELKDPQKVTIEKLEKGLTADESTPKPEIKDLHADLIAQVKAGKIDNAKLEPRLAAIDKAMQAHQEKEAETLGALHDALDPAQRKALAADLRAKMDAHEPPADHGAKGEEWQKKKVEHLTSTLSLDAAQQKTVEGIVAKDTTMTPATMATHKADMKKRMEALLTAFEADTFDAKKTLAANAPANKPREMIDHEVMFLSQLLPVLKPEQREKLAAEIEKRASMMHGGMAGMHPWLGGDDDGPDAKPEPEAKPMP